METDPIETQEQCADAIAEVDAHGDPQAGTADFSRLDHLVDQVVEYEAYNTR